MIATFVPVSAEYIVIQERRGLHFCFVIIINLLHLNLNFTVNYLLFITPFMISVLATNSEPTRVYLRQFLEHFHTVHNRFRFFLAMASDTPRVLSVQSHVVHGYVGNKSAVFPLQVLGFEVDSINTVQFSNHTAYQHVKGTVLDNKDLEELMQGLALNGVDYYTHFLTGYSRSPDSLKQIAGIIKKLREKNPKLIYVCDPVMGDNGKMYVPEEILPVYRDEVVPLADILTPNQFEAEQITGLSMKDLSGALKVIQALHQKGVKTVVLSSTDLGDDNSMIGIASTKGGSCFKIEIPKVDTNFTGTGDLFAALFLAWSHKTNNNIKLTLEKTIATLQSIVKDTYKKAREQQPKDKLPAKLVELRIIQNKHTIEDPIVDIQAVEVKV